MDNFVKTIYLNSERKTKSGIFGGEKDLDEVDGEDLASRIESECNALVSEGYKIANIMPINSGDHNFKNGVGYGYGYTSGVIIVANKV